MSLSPILISSNTPSWRKAVVAAIYVLTYTTTTIVGFTLPSPTQKALRQQSHCQQVLIQFSNQRRRHQTFLLSSEAEASVIAEETTTTTSEKQMLDGRKINGPVVPLNNFVLIRVAKAIEATTGGILLSGKAKQVKTEGTVVAVGPGKTHPDSGITVPMPVHVGMNVVYGKYDGTEIDYNGQKHTLIRDDDVLITYTSSVLDSLDTVEVVRDNILVYVEENEVATEGGILIAKSSKSESSKPSIGAVIKIGPGKMAANGEIMSISTSTTTTTDDSTSLLQIGDYIKFRDYAGNEVMIDGKEYTVVKMADVLAKF